MNFSLCHLALVLAIFAKCVIQNVHLQLIMFLPLVVTTIADILGANTNSDSDSDISWIFVKEAGQPGLFHAAHSPLGENDVLVRNS